MIFVDTNYFLRFLLKDVEKQYLKAQKLMIDAIRGKLKLFTSTIVFFELYWVLSSYYGRNKLELTHTLKDVLDLEFIELKERPILQVALEKFAKWNLSLEDCYNLVFAKSNNAKGFKTFDKKLARFFSKEK